MYFVSYWSSIECCNINWICCTFVVGHFRHDLDLTRLLSRIFISFNKRTSRSAIISICLSIFSIRFERNVLGTHTVSAESSVLKTTSTSWLMMSSTVVPRVSRMSSSTLSESFANLKRESTPILCFLAQARTFWYFSFRDKDFFPKSSKRAPFAAILTEKKKSLSSRCHIFLFRLEAYHEELNVREEMFLFALAVDEDEFAEIDREMRRRGDVEPPYVRFDLNKTRTLSVEWLTIPFFARRKQVPQSALSMKKRLMCKTEKKSFLATQ